MANLIAAKSQFSVQIHPVNVDRAIMTIVGVSHTTIHDRILRDIGMSSRDLMTSSEGYIIAEVNLRGKQLKQYTIRDIRDGIVRELILHEIWRKQNFGDRRL